MAAASLTRSGIVGAMVGLMWLASSPNAIGQAKDRRLDEALVDISVLKHLVVEQSRRIADLEKTVGTLQASAIANPQRPPAVGDHAKTGKPVPAIAWQLPSRWSRVKEGMSRAQVVELLGPPTSVDSVLDYQTLIYKGDERDTSGLTGSVKLTDDRVSEVNSPEF